MRNNTFLVALIFFLLCGVVESMLARYVSPNLQNRTTIVLFVLSGSILSACAFSFAKQQFMRALTAAWPLLIFAVLAIISMSWSITPEASLMSAVASMFLVMACVSLVALSDWRSLLKGMTLACLVIGVLSLILIPVGGLMVELHEGALRGPFGEKNRAGMVYAIGAISSGGLAFVVRKVAWLLPIPFFIGLLLLSQSGTSTISCAIGLAALAYCEMLRGTSSRLVLGVWVGVLGGLGIFSIVVLNAETILNMVGEDSTFTGRDRIWPAVWWRVLESPWLGYGYDAYWRRANPGMAWLWYEVGFEVYNAHNGWLETMLAVGVFGTALLFWTVLRTGVAGLTGLYQANDPRRVAIPMIAMIVMMSLTESAIGGPEGPSWLLLLLISTKAAMGEERLTRRAKQTRHRGRVQRRSAYI